MTPIYDRDTNLIGWIDEEWRHFFDENLDWVAFISNDNAWSASTSNWLGPVGGGNLYDRHGKFFGWMPGAQFLVRTKPFTPFTPFRPFQPFKPFKPFTPFKPFRPMIPEVRWSRLSFEEWLSQ